MSSQIFTLELDGKTIHFDFGKYAQLANGSVMATCGGTTILATATMKPKASDLDFMPLSISYQEKMYAAGMIKSSRFNKREGRPADDKILTGRVIDRSLRPLFPKDLRNETQIMLTTISYDRENEHDMLAGIAASAALSVSNIPWNGPISMVRVGIIDGHLVLNPTFEQRTHSDLDLIVSSSAENVVMIEAGAKEVSEEKMLEAIEFGKKWGQKVCSFISEIQEKIGKPKVEIEESKKDEEIEKWVSEKFTQEFTDCLWGIPGKQERMTRKDEIYTKAKESAIEAFDEERVEKFINKACDKVWKTILRDAILNHEKRIAERKLTQIRPLSTEVGMFERVHGSALFQRGETQGLSIVTLAPPSEKLITEGIEGEKKHRYMHHYNFPPYSVGDVSNRLSTGNREIGHGALAQRGLEAVLPNEEDFPYTIRVVTEILQSNGSSSMAATCGSSLALMDAGVPIKSPVAGIAMGLITSEDGGNYKILSDIQDDEDFVGDMDFKVTGTAEGITAIQMDIKILGLTSDIFKKALAQAKDGRLEILKHMNTTIDAAREDISQYAPRLITVQINPEKIGKLIGKGGETIQKITAETECEIEIKDDGQVIIASTDKEKAEQARKIIELITASPVIGKIYEGKIMRIEAFGAFVEILPEIQGMVHVSMIKNERVENINTELKEGEEVRVKLIDIDDKGRLKLSIKDVLSSEK